MNFESPFGRALAEFLAIIGLIFWAWLDYSRTRAEKKEFKRKGF